MAFFEANDKTSVQFLHLNRLTRQCLYKEPLSQVTYEKNIEIFNKGTLCLKNLNHLNAPNIFIHYIILKMIGEPKKVSTGKRIYTRASKAVQST